MNNKSEALNTFFFIKKNDFQLKPIIIEFTNIGNHFYFALNLPILFLSKASAVLFYQVPTYHTHIHFNFLPFYYY